ncbi:MAG: HEAT repeat domain-containing protein [bacterium]|nr:HEAT repeat domain-containing protein [bacterium]
MATCCIADMTAEVGKGWLSGSSRVALCWGLVLGLCLTGCGRSHTRFKHPRLMNEGDCAACLETALEAESPDARREAVVHLSKTDQLSNEVVIRGLSTIAETDRSDAVRTSAVRALAKSGAPEAVGPLVKLAFRADEEVEARRPRAGAVRWAAMEGLDPLLRADRLSEEQRQACRTGALRLLRTHRSRDVRLASAVLLAYFPDRDVLEGLIDALDQRDFGVVYQSERSLNHLTGHRFENDSAAWRRWLTSTDDPFADSGRLADELDPKDGNWWDRTVKGTRRAFAGFGPK